MDLALDMGHGTYVEVRSRNPNMLGVDWFWGPRNPWILSRANGIHKKYLSTFEMKDEFLSNGRINHPTRSQRCTKQGGLQSQRLSPPRLAYATQ